MVFNHLLLCTNDTHIHREYWHKGGSLGCDCRGNAAGVLLHTDL